MGVTTETAILSFLKRAEERSAERQDAIFRVLTNIEWFLRQAYERENAPT